MLTTADRDKPAADVEPHAVAARELQQLGERAGAAAEIDHARMRGKPAQAHELTDEAGARLRGKDIVVVIGGMAVEERDLGLLVLLLGSPLRVRRILRRSQ